MFKREYYICFIDQCLDKLVRNLAEYWYMELEWQVNGYEHLGIADNLENAINKFYQSKYNHGILIDTRNDLEGNSTSNFVKFLDEALTGTESILGDETLLYINRSIWNKKDPPKKFDNVFSQYRYFLQDEVSIYKFVKKNFERKFYSLNTENIKYSSLNKNLSSMTTVASGLNHLRIIKEVGYTKDFELIFCDWDNYSLYLMKKIYEEWDGKNYFEFLDHHDILKARTHKNSNFTELFDGFYDWFNMFRDSIKVQYIHHDFLRSLHHRKNELFKEELSKTNGNKLVWLSNIFCYRPTAIFKSLHTRCIFQDQLMDDLKDIDNLQISYGSAINNWNDGWIMSPKDYKPCAEHAKNLIKWNS